MTHHHISFPFITSPFRPQILTWSEDALRGCRRLIPSALGRSSPESTQAEVFAGLAGLLRTLGAEAEPGKGLFEKVAAAAAAFFQESVAIGEAMGSLSLLLLQIVPKGAIRKKAENPKKKKAGLRFAGQEGKDGDKVGKEAGEAEKVHDHEGDSEEKKPQQQLRSLPTSLARRICVDSLRMVFGSPGENSSPLDETVASVQLDFLTGLARSGAFSCGPLLGEVLEEVGLSSGDECSPGMALLRGPLLGAADGTDAAAARRLLPVRRGACSLAVALAADDSGLLRSEAERDEFRRRAAAADPRWLSAMVEAVCARRDTEMARRWLASEEFGVRVAEVAAGMAAIDDGDDEESSWDLLGVAFRNGKDLMTSS